jgi:polyphosphate kinase
LQEAGIKVIAGIPGLKVHCKIFQISRKINGKTHRLTHIGTGNFHEKTAKIYSDTTLLTSHLEIGREIRRLFDFFESNYLRPKFTHLAVSPFNTRRKLLEGIQQEIKHCQKGEKGSIIIKVNNLMDDQITRKLLDAAEHGVKIQLIVRGVCLLTPTTPKQIQNIHMRSILGRYLEHSRIFIFGEGERQKIWLGSADLMVRNLDYRIEVLAPIYDLKLKNEINHWMKIQCGEDAKARNLLPAFINQPIQASTKIESHDTQVSFLNYLLGKKKTQ